MANKALYDEAMRSRSIISNPTKYLPEKTRLDLSGGGRSGNNASGAGTGSGVASTSTGTGNAKASKSGSTGTVSGYGSLINARDLYDAQMASQQAAANEAYNNTMARIAAAYESMKGNIQANYDSSVDRLGKARDRSMRSVNTDAEDSLRQAYINNELTKRNLNQRLSAMGYNGGATESTMASLANQYGNSRNGINRELNGNIADLEATYSDNLASALEAYNNAMTNLEFQKMQLENAAETARANMSATAPGIESLITMDQGYLTALQNAIANQGNFTFDPTQATNNYIPGQAQQANAAVDTTAYSKALQQAQLLANQGASADAIKQNLYNMQSSGAFGSPTNTTTLAQILKQLGI